MMAGRRDGTLLSRDSRRALFSSRCLCCVLQYSGVYDVFREALLFGSFCHSNSNSKPTLLIAAQLSARCTSWRSFIINMIWLHINCLYASFSIAREYPTTVNRKDTILFSLGSKNKNIFFPSGSGFGSAASGSGFEG